MTTIPAIQWLAIAAQLAFLLAALKVFRPSRKQTAAAVLASGWAMPASIVCELIGHHFGLWPGSRSFLFAVSPTLLIGRTLLLGIIAAICFPSLPLRWLYLPALALDLGLVRFTLGPVRGSHFVAETMIVAFVFIPAQLFARWTTNDRRLMARSLLHPIFHASLLLGVVPSVLVACGFGSWTAPFLRAPWINKIYLQLLLIPAVVLLSAVQEFAQQGEGTPMPADPPKRLVTTGVYAYVANPMQIGKLLVVAAWGIFWGNFWLLAVAGLGALYSLFIASPREDRAMDRRFPVGWGQYRQSVRRWWPRWRPYFPSSTIASAPARLYLDTSCQPCSQLAAWFCRQNPTGLAIVPSGGAFNSSKRIIYEASDGAQTQTGAIALARAVEHLNLGWAFFGWMVRLPGIGLLAQMVADCFDPRRHANCEVAMQGARIQT